MSHAKVKVVVPALTQSVSALQLPVLGPVPVPVVPEHEYVVELQVPASLAAQSASVEHSTQDQVPLSWTQPGNGSTQALHSLLAVEAAHLLVARSHLGPTPLDAQWVSLAHSTHWPLASLIGVDPVQGPLVMQVCLFTSHLPPLQSPSARQSTHAPPKHLVGQEEQPEAGVQLAP